MTETDRGRSVLLKLFGMDRGLSRTPPWKSAGDGPSPTRAEAGTPQPNRGRRQALLQVFGLEQGLRYDPPWKK